VREVGKIRALGRSGEVTRIDLSAPLCAPVLAVGDSLAVQGICLTVVSRRGPLVAVEAAEETRRISTMPWWRAGDWVHLEPALRVGDALGGHLVLGHVDGIGRVAGIRMRGRSWFLTITLPAILARYLLPKGSVAVDGVSLTVDGGPFRDRFTVNVIPHTLAATRLGELRVGERVNLEMDVLVKAARGEGMPAEASLSNGAASPAPAMPAGAQPPRTMGDLLARGFRRRGRGDRST
jgi:riboflavin synthase